MTDEEQQAYERLQATQTRMESLWDERVSKPDEFGAALNEFNGAGAALNALWEERDH